MQLITFILYVHITLTLCHQFIMLVDVDLFNKGLILVPLEAF